MFKLPSEYISEKSYSKHFANDVCHLPESFSFVFEFEPIRREWIGCQAFRMFSIQVIDWLNVFHFIIMMNISADFRIQLRKHCDIHFDSKRHLKVHAAIFRFGIYNYELLNSQQERKRKVKNLFNVAHFFVNIHPIDEKKKRRKDRDSIRFNSLFGFFSFCLIIVINWNCDSE